MKAGYLITARLKSTRLARKVLLEIGGRPYLSHMIDRLKRAKCIDEIVICTSTNHQDDPLEELANTEGVRCFRGDEEDVVARLYHACRAENLDYALNITADCPLVDPDYADRIVAAYRTTGADLIRTFGLPHGAFSYGLKPEALEKIVSIKNDNHTEVWGKYFTDTDLFDVHDLEIDKEHQWADLRMTLDYPEDDAFFRALWDTMKRPPHQASLDEILEFLRAHPEIVAINSGCADRFLRRFKSQASIHLKPRYEVRRAAIVGAGSIGQRHIRSLRALGITDIVALRTRQGHAQALPAELEVAEVSSWDELAAAKPDIAIVANPTSLHLETARKLVPHVRGLFIEKPLSASFEGIADLLEAVKQARMTTFMGHNLSFHPIVKTIGAALRSGKYGLPLSYQGSVGHWLPDWHPYEDYKTSYTARPELGGGVALTLIHEVQMALEWMGPADGVTGVFPSNRELPLDVDVQADIMIQHEGSGVSQLHLDFIQRPFHRAGRVCCERGWLSYDFVRGEVLAHADGEATSKVLWCEPGYDVQDCYESMMGNFLACVREGRVRHELDIHGGIEGLSVVLAAFDSEKQKRWIQPKMTEKA